MAKSERDILLMLWDSQEDIREMNQSHLDHAEGWLSDSENTEKEKTKKDIKKLKVRVRNSEICLKYLIKKLKEIS